MENISVSVRIRPLNQQEADKGSAWRVDGNSVLPRNPGELARDAAATYTLDHVFDDAWTTDRIYQATTEKIVQGVVQGINGTVFAYGQTSSGKTFTMRGTEDVPGIIPLAVRNTFAAIEAMQDREFLIRVSYMELYNEDINDLLAPENSKLQVHESREGYPFVAGLREDIVTGADQVLALLDAGERHRHIGETRMNKNSSRSHTIFRMVVESRARDQSAAVADSGAVWVSALTLVDLAGSERASKTGAEGVRMKEGASINKSLLVLGNVINKLSEGVQLQGGHIPYRDSKLTRILQPSLGGNARTAIICNMTPAAVHAEESHSTLRFACRAKCVVNNAVVNEVLSDAAVLKRQAREIEELRSRLAEGGVGLSDEVEAEIARLRAQLLEKERQHELVACQLEAERVEREKAQRKVDGLTRLMLEGGRDAGSAEQGRAAAFDRRLTWCPGKQQERKRAHIQLDDLHDEAVLLGSVRETGSPPPKRHEPAPGDDAALQQELQALQQQLAANAAALEETQHALEAAAAERDKLLPQVEESKWRARQLERERDTHAARAKELAQAEASLSEEVTLLRSQVTQQEGSLLGELEAARREASVAKEALAATQQRLDDAVQDHENDRQELARLVAKRKTHSQELDALRAQLESKDADAAQRAADQDALQERLASAEAAARDLQETNARLEAHVADLEKRKRAPLYQKKQEEELRAAMDKATEAEARAAEAEARCKEAKADKEAADKAAEAARAHMEQVTAALRDELEEVQQQHASALERLRADHGRVEVTLHEEVALLQGRLEAAEAAAAAAREEAEAARQEAEVLRDEGQALRGAAVEHEAAMGELQACADAAAERIAALEEQLTSDAAEFEAAKGATEAAHAAALTAVKDELEAARLAAEATLHLARTQHEQAVAALESQLSEARSSLAATTSGAEASQVTWEAQRSELQARVDSLQARVEAAAAALTAADELKELRRKYKQEVAALNAQLKGANAASKGGEREGERLKKDAEKLRDKVKSLEEGLRAAKVEKTNALLEKANVERELKALKDKTERLTKNLERSDSVHEKRRESMAAGLNKAKSALTETEEALATAKLHLEQTQFALTAKTGECEGLAQELHDAAAKHAALEEHHAALQEAHAVLQDTHTTLQEDHAALESKHDEATQRVQALEADLATQQEAHDNLKKEASQMEATRDDLQRQLQEATQALDAARARLPEIEELQRQVAAAHEAMSDARFAHETAAKAASEALDAAQQATREVQDARDALEAQLGTREAELGALRGRCEELEGQLGALQGALAEAAEAQASKAAYVDQLEGQLAELDADHTVVKTTLEQTAAQLEAAQQALATATAAADELRASAAAAAHAHADAMAAAAHDAAVKLAEAAAQHQEAERGWESDMQAAVDRATQWKEFAERVGSERDAALARVTDLEAAASQLHAEVAQLQSVQGRLAEVESLLAERLATQHDLHAALAAANERVHEAEAARASVQQQLEEAAARATAAERSAIEWQRAAAAAESNAAAVQSQLEAAANEAACQVQRLRAEAAAVKAELDEQRGAVDGARAQQHADAMAMEVPLHDGVVVWCHGAVALQARHAAAVQAEQALRVQIQHEAQAAAEQLAEERSAVAHLQQRLAAAKEEAGAAAAAAEAHRKELAQALAELRAKALQLEQLEQRTPAPAEPAQALHAELRKSKRREEKLNALVFRMRQDVEALTKDPGAFSRLQDVRALEYELDFANNKAARERTTLQAEITALKARMDKAGRTEGPLGVRDENALPSL